MKSEMFLWMMISVFWFYDLNNTECMCFLGPIYTWLTPACLTAEGYKKKAASVYLSNGKDAVKTNNN